MRYFLIFLILVTLFSGCMSDVNINQNNDSKVVTNTSSENPNIEVESVFENSSNLTSIPFKVLEFGIYGDTYKHYESKLEGNKTIIEVYMGKKLGIAYSIEVVSVYKEDDKLIVIVEETEPEDYSNRIVVYPYEIIEVDGQYKNVEFKNN